MIDNDRAAMDALNRYWDEVVVGAPVQPHALDGGLATAVRHLHTMDDAPMVDAAFAERLWHELMRSAPPIARPTWRRRLLDRPRRAVAPLAVVAALLVALFAALVGVYPWAAPPPPVNAQDIVRKSIAASSMRGAVHSFYLEERVTRQPGNSGLPLFTGYKGVVESAVTRWYEAPNRWRIERRYLIPPRGTLAREYDPPGVQVNDGKVVQNYDEGSRTVQLQYPPFPSGTADLFPLGAGDAASASGQTLGSLYDVVSGWYRELGGVRSVSFVRGGAYITLTSALLPQDNLIELAGSLVPVAGGKPLQPNPPVRGLAALRARVPFPIFVPMDVPRGLTPREPALGTAGSLITINYDAPDGTAALSVANGAAGCCLDQDARKGQDHVTLPNGAVAHFIPNEPQFGGPILWVDEDGSYAAISGPLLTRSEETKIAASLSKTAGLRAE